jgi:hypothetical protein
MLAAYLLYICKRTEGGDIIEIDISNIVNMYGLAVSFYFFSIILLKLTVRC